MWQNINFGGTKWTYGISSYPQNEWFYVGSGANDEASSFDNDRVHSTYVSQNYPASGGEYCEGSEGIQPELQKNTWPQNGDSMNDSISAIALESTNPC
jgi:hypothetical protein